MRVLFIMVLLSSALVWSSCSGEQRSVRAQLDPTIPSFASVELRRVEQLTDVGDFVAARASVTGYPSLGLLRNACLKLLYTSGSLRRSDEPVVCSVSGTGSADERWLCTWMEPSTLSDFELIDSVAEACGGQIQPP